MENVYEFLFDRTLSQSAINRQPSDYNKTIYSPDDTIVEVPYSLNEYGYRSGPFHKDNEILILGCSQTYGSGLPNEFTWPEIFSKSVDKKYSRLAHPGDSINGQVYKAFNYFKEIGNPKVILGLFPIYRLEYPAIPDEFLHPRASLNFLGRFNDGELRWPAPAVAYFQYDIAQFSKAPHDPAYVIPKEFVLFYNFIFIKMLDQYCESNNIKFIWSLYDEFPPKTNLSGVFNSKQIQEYMGNTSSQILKNFLETSDVQQKWHSDLESTISLSDESIENKLLMFAADFDKKRGVGHWGVLTNKQIAEKFLERYKEINND